MLIVIISGDPDQKNEKGKIRSEEIQLKEETV